MKTSKTLSVITLCVIIFLITISAKAEILLPNFSGEWTDWYDFDVHPRLAAIDSCTQQYFDYSQVGRIAGAPEKAAIAFFTKKVLPVHTDCIWQRDIAICSKDPSYGHPSDFLGGSKEWSKIVNSGSENITQKCKIQCVAENKIIDTASITIEPIYSTCQDNSRFGLDKDRFEAGDYDDVLGCSTRPMVCDYDIVGREGRAWYSIFGHLGLTGYNEFGSPFTDDQDTVVEVLKDVKEPANPKDIVQLNSFDSLRLPTSQYWGARYISPYLDIHQDVSMQDNTRMQRGIDDAHPCDSATYLFESTSKDAWHPCMLDPKDGKVKAVWRCDYFANYIYSAAGIPIVPDFDPRVDKPHTIFDSLPQTRFNGDKLESSEVLNNLLGKNLSRTTEKSSDNLIQEKVIEYSQYSIEDLEKKLMSTFDNLNDENFNNLYPIYKAFSEHKNISRQTKLQYMWFLAMRYQDNPDKFNGVFGFIKPLYPIELVDKLIQSFYIEKQYDNKIQILDMLNYLVENDPSDELKNSNALIVLKNSQKTKIQDFFKREVFSDEKDLNILTAILTNYYIGVFSNEQSLEDLTQVFLINDIDSKLLRNNVYSKIGLGVFLQVNDLDLRRKYLGDYLNYINENKDHQRTFSQILYYYFTPSTVFSKDSMSGYDISRIDESTRQILLHHLASNKPSVNIQAIIQNTPPSFIAIRQKCSDMYFWLYADSVLRASSYQIADKKVASDILSIGDVNLKYLLLSFASKGVYKNISTSVLLGGYRDLETKVNMPLLTPKSGKKNNNVAMQTRKFQENLYIIMKNKLEERQAGKI